jgi:Tfp pilus assembly protein PilF
MLGEIEEAKALLKTALEQSPEDSYAQQLLALIGGA